MENSEDNSEQNPLKSASYTDSDENLIINQAFVADNNGCSDFNNQVAKNNQLITDTDVQGCTTRRVNVQCESISAQNQKRNNPPSSNSVNTLNEGNDEEGKSNWVYVQNPPDLHFPDIDMNVDIEGSKGVTTTTTTTAESAAAAAVGSMNIVAAPSGKVNTGSGGGGVEVGPGPRNRSSPPNCPNRMTGDAHYSSGTAMTQQQQTSSSSSYAAEFDPLSMNSRTVNNSHTNGASGISYARGYGAESSMFRGINRYNDPGASSGGNGGTIQNIAVSAASSTATGDLIAGCGSERGAYEFLDREMQYMLKFADPDQNLASMDELIQSGVDLLDLLPPEEGGVKPRFSNPSNDWKYDIIARYVDECNPVSECTCHLYDDGRPHDIHLCSVHHDTVSQDSDTLTMDTEGSLVNIPTIKLHATYVDGKSDHKNNNNSRSVVSDDTNSGATTTTTHSQQNHTTSEVIDISAQRQDAMRTEANNAGGNSVVGYDVSSSCSEGRRDLQGRSVCNEESSGDKSADRSLVDTANDTHQYYGVDGTTTTGTNNSSTSTHHSISNEHKASVTDAQLSVGHQGQGDQQSGDATGINSTVFAEVHVDAMAMKYDEPTTVVGEAGDRNRKAPLQNRHSHSLETNTRPHDPIRKTLSDETGRSARGSPDKHAPSYSSTASPPSHQQSRQQASSNDTVKSTATTTTSTSDAAPAAAKINPDPSLSSPAKSSPPSSGAEASTSAKEKEKYEKFLSRQPTTTAQDHRKRAFKKRPSLPIEPRTTQYQKHALLQERSDTGVLEFELLLAERFEDEQMPRRESLGSRKCSLDSSRMKLMPRTNQYEPHPLLRKTNSGMSEIEEVLQEKEQEFLRRMKEKRDSLEANSQPDSKRFMLHRGSLGRLEPRLGQYEKHSLLQSKDEDGRTALEMFLEEEMIERKASMTDQDAANFSDKEKLAPKKSNTSDSSSNKGSIKKSRSKSSSLKKVHFERSGSKDKKKKPEDPESGISSKGEVSSTSDPKQESAAHNETQGQVQGQEVDNGYDTDDDDKTEEDRLTGERAKAKLNKDQGKCCTIL